MRRQELSSLLKGRLKGISGEQSQWRYDLRRTGNEKADIGADLRNTGER
jgi:hypothetical protein